MTGSNVQSDNVTKITSQATSIPIHNRAIGSSGVAWNSAAVPRTPQIITGTVIGYSNTGSSVSRLRTRTSIAANRVPTAAKPSVPAISSVISLPGNAKIGALNSNATNGTRM